jgi:hypothetical protein
MLKFGTVVYFIETMHGVNETCYSVKSKVWNRGIFGAPRWFENHVAGPFLDKAQAQEIYEKVKLL